MASLRKQCSKCGHVLLIENFSKNPSTSDGLRSSCKKCEAQYRKEYLKNGGLEKYRIYAKANSVKVITSSLVSKAKARAKDKNLPFDIDLDYVRSMVGENAELAFHCPVFGIPLDWSRIRNNGNRALPNSPSIDRIDPARGYIKENIWVISHRANTIKNDATHEELKLVTKAVGEAIVNSLEF
jgi:hypothetical protein